MKRQGYVKMRRERMLAEAERIERWNNAVETAQDICHGFGLVIGGIGLMYAVAVGCCIIIGAEIGLPCIIGTMSAVGIGALLLVM